MKRSTRMRVAAFKKNNLYFMKRRRACASPLSKSMDNVDTAVLSFLYLNLSMVVIDSLKLIFPCDVFVGVSTGSNAIFELF